MHIHAVNVYIPNVFVRFTTLEIVVPAALHVFESLIGEERVSLPSGGLGDAILQEPVDQIDVCA